ncbi:HELQ-like protein [Mya arenaria]|uniref:HELQ-like protein n=1 Tax=Mya arenaria TaxID=6604 RepID=A0ABY7FIJ7_MYAAR|nr:HELQ-like protein [Mya arenaria]
MHMLKEILHMLGEGGSRGSTLEATLLKILHSAGGATQVQLTEFVKLTDNIYKVEPKALGSDDQITHDRVVNFEYKPEMVKVDPDHLLGLVLEVVPQNSCLLFCPTKKNFRRVERKALLKELYSDSEGRMCPTLQYTIHYGVAYHHSGLTTDERKLIEEAYSEGILCLLACTSTLAAGVNLPAKRVILRSPYVGQSFLSRSQYKQMVGRAGRAGIDSSGESILVCKATDKNKVVDLLSCPIEKCHSSLVYDGGRGIRSLLLSTIGLKVTTTTEDVFRFTNRSLAHIQQSALNVSMATLCQESLQKLIDSGLVLQTKSLSEEPEKGESVIHSLEVTPLGKATFKGPIDPDFAGLLYADLKQAEESIVLSTHLHLLYLVTPYDVVTTMNPSWHIYFNQYGTFDQSELKVASLIGVPESYVAKRAAMQKSRLKVNEFVVKRFYLTLMLYDLWREKSVWEVAEKFEQPRGFIQNLLSGAASFASCVAHFCQDLLGNFVRRLSYCVTIELIPLMEIPGVKLGRARLMFAAGYKTLSSVAAAKPEDLVKAVQYMPRKVAKQIVASSQLVLSEKKDAMMEEVDALVSVPKGVEPTGTMATIPTPAPVTPAPDSQASDING